MKTGQLFFAILFTALNGFTQTSDRPRCPRPDRPCYFSSFEKSGEAEQWKSLGQATVSQSTDFPSWQTHSLRIGIPSGVSGGVETSYVPDSWRRYQALQFFVYAERPAALTVELGSGAATAAKNFKLKQGSNHVQVRLKGLAGIDLGAIDRLKLTAGGENTLYLDRFALDEYNEVLANFGRMDAPYELTIETPHVKWARPFANGPLNILIVPDVAHGRAAIELAQRLDCTLYPVSLGERSGTNRWGFGDFYGERGDSYGAPFTLAYTYLADSLLNGPKYDVMVLPGTRPWDEFPEIVRKTIRKRVEDGMGLVLLDMTVNDPGKAEDLFAISSLRPLERGRSAAKWEATGDEFITRNVPLAAFPYEQMRHVRSSAAGKVLIRTDGGDPILAVRTVGKGRVVAAAWEQRSMIPQIQGQFRASASWRYWEYMYSLLARSTVWAAAKEPQAGLGTVRFDGAASPKRATIHSSGAATVDVTVRNEHWLSEQTARKPAAASTELTLPETPNGCLHFVDVILRDKAGKVIDWGTASYETAPPAEIAGIRFSADRFKLGTPVTGELELKSTGAPGLALRTSLFDNYGRLLVERSEPLPPGATRAPFSLSSEGALSRVVWLEGRIEQKGLERHRMRRDVFILQPAKWDHYDVVMYLFGSDPAPGLWNTVQQRLKEMFVTTLSSYPLELSKYANFGVQAQTRISGQESPDGAAREPYLEQKRKYLQTRNKEYLARLSCLSDPEYLKRQEREIEKLVSPWVPFSPMSYYIYEEPALTCYEDAWDLCFSPHCLAKLREWLKKEYVSLEALNREWGSGFARWEDIIPDTTEEAQKKNNYAAWADHRTFMEEVYAGNYAYVRDLLHRHDPEGLVLLSGTQESSPHNGCDYYQLDQIVGHLNPYRGGNQLEMHRSFNPKLRSSGGTGYGAHGRAAAYNLYSDLYHGFWAGAYIFWQYSILNPDYQFCGSARDIQKVLGELQGDGVARLIASATRDNMRIAMHYSYPSIHGTWIPDGHVTRPDQNPSMNAGPTGEKFMDNRDGWTNILKDLGFQFDMVARQQIEAGELLNKGFRVLVLPFSVAITDKEVAEIRKFVEAGGVVIADGQAGVMNGHCRWLPKGSLDDLFGIERGAPARQKELASSAPETNLKTAGAKALAMMDGAPAVIVRDRGKGKAIYLNFFFANYVEERRDGKEGKWKDLLRQALGAADVQPPYRVLAEGGKPLEGFELIAFQSGAARYLGILKNDDLEVRETPMTVELDGAFHVYDVRGKRALGRTTAIRDSIRTAEPKLYALLPAAAGAVKVTARGEAKRGARFGYSVTAGAGKDVNAVVIVRVYRPDGALAREYSENIEAKGGSGASGFHLALNDPAGTWKVVATDAVSGNTATLAFQVR